MPRPSDDPTTWATDTNFPAGSDPWSATPTKVEPNSGEKAAGAAPATGLTAQLLNWLFNNITAWVSYLDAIPSHFGDGSDGDATLDGTVAAPAWASKAGSIYTATRDVFADNLTVTGAGVELKMAGFRLFARNVLTTSGGAIVHENGTDATSSGGAAATKTTSDGSLIGLGQAGGDGGNPNNGIAGGNAALSLGGTGGAGGAGTSGTGGAASTVTPPTAVQGGAHGWAGLHSGYILGNNAGTPALNPLYGGAGGGGGGGDGVSAPGGGGGGGGGVMVVAARQIVCDTVNDIQVRGGNGNDGAGSLGGGGGGGGGGLLIIAYAGSNVAFSAANNAPGGAGGANGANPGDAGGNGTVVDLGRP